MLRLRTRVALLLSVLTLLLGASSGCTNLPGFLKRTLAASPSPAALEEPGDDEAQPIEGQVGNGPSSSQAPMTATVRLAGAAFAPTQVTVKKGGSVTFINDDAMSHSVVPRSGAQFATSSVFTQGQQVTITFAQAGEQPYACGLHATMTGTVTVQE